MTTSAPAAPNASAHASPIPEFAPVTRAFCFLRGFSGSGELFTSMNFLRTVISRGRKGKRFRFMRPRSQRHRTSSPYAWVQNDLKMRLATEIQGDETSAKNPAQSESPSSSNSTQKHETH